MGAQVLIAGCDRDSCDLYTFLLKDYGVQVFPVASVGEARRFLANQRIDVVLSEDYLPGEDGMSLVQAIAQLNWISGRAIRTIALTTHPDLAYSQHLIEAGFERCLRKPFDLDELVDAVKSLLPCPVHAFTSDYSFKRSSDSLTRLA